MRNMTKTIALLFLGGMALTSCTKDVKVSDEIPQSVKDQIYAVGFGTSNIQKIEEGYLVEGDIVLTEEYLNSNPQRLIVRAGDEEQYHTTNLVTGLPRAITLSLSSKLAALPGYNQALAVVRDRYNAENLNLTFSIVSPGTGNINYVEGHGQYLASAGFPSSNGTPYGTVKVNAQYLGSGTSSTFINYVGTIMTHEAGHCIGFRHTDYMNRAFSCGGAASNEGASTVGAIWIPNTPTGPDSGSWMLACIGANQNRPFNNNDKTALNALY